MTDQELIQTLRDDAEWAEANEWETPITLGDDLYTAASRLEELTRWVPAEERLPEIGQSVLVVVYGKPRENITLEGAVELADYDTDGWTLDTWPEW